MEREIVMGGIGGQGVQLATKILAHALNNEHRYVMHFAAFGGTVRGGNVECTVVTGTGPILAPPIVPKAWLVVAMHQNPVAIVGPKTRPDGLFVANRPLATDFKAVQTEMIVELPASRIAEELGDVQGASMIMLGAVCKATGLVSVDQLIEGLKALTPSYRKQTIPQNVKAFNAGEAYADKHLKGFQVRAWELAAA